MCATAQRDNGDEARSSPRCLLHLQSSRPGDYRLCAILSTLIRFASQALLYALRLCALLREPRVSSSLLCVMICNIRVVNTFVRIKSRSFGQLSLTVSNRGGTDMQYPARYLIM